MWIAKPKFITGLKRPETELQLVIFIETYTILSCNEKK